MGMFPNFRSYKPQSSGGGAGSGLSRIAQYLENFGSAGAFDFNGSAVTGFTLVGSTYTFTGTGLAGLAPDSFTIRSGYTVTYSNIGGPLVCKGTVTIESGAILLPQNVKNGSNSAANTGGTGASTDATQLLAVGTGGGAGNAAAGGASSAASGLPIYFGGQGGAGGAGGTGAGGNPAAKPAITVPYRYFEAMIIGGLYGYSLRPFVGGIGGGGGGGDGTNRGGGGGLGGAGFIINARAIINNGLVNCKGGNGGSQTTTGNAGGGAGGGGGYIFTNTAEANSGSGIFDVSGGTGGAGFGTGAAGANGNAGTFLSNVWA